MTLDEAIKRLQARVDGEFYIEGEDDCADMKLGIEALREHKKRRGNTKHLEIWLLLGETKE